MIVLSLILAHLLADFYFQTEKMVNEKRKYLKIHLLHHFLIVFLTLGLVFLFWEGDNFLYQVLFASVLLVAIHFTIDLTKIKLQENISFIKQSNAWNLGLFVADQVLHIFSIFIVCYFFFQLDLYNLFTEMLISLQLLDGPQQSYSLLNSALFLIIMLILITSVTGHLIKLLLGSLTKHISLFEGKYTVSNVDISKNQQKNMSEEYTYMVIKPQDLSRGKVIGYLERLLVVALILMGSFHAVGFIVAAKSLTRFKQMDDRDWAEYFLLGTLTSFLLAIMFGMILKVVFLG